MYALSAWYTIRAWKLFKKWQILSCFLSTNAQSLLLPPPAFLPFSVPSTDLNASRWLPFRSDFAHPFTQ